MDFLRYFRDYRINQHSFLSFKHFPQNYIKYNGVTTLVHLFLQAIHHFFAE